MVKISDFTDDPTPPPTEGPNGEVDESAMLIGVVADFVSAHIAELGDKLAAAIITRGICTERGAVDAVIVYTRALEAIQQAAGAAQKAKDGSYGKEQEVRREEEGES